VCEIVHDDGEEDDAPPSIEDNQIATIVDQVLDYDVNQDGMIDYLEFMTAQKLSQKNEERKSKKCTTCGDT